MKQGLRVVIELKVLLLLIYVYDVLVIEDRLNYDNVSSDIDEVLVHL